MKLPTSKIELCCSTETYRPHLQYVHLDADRRMLEVTDGHVAVRVPVELDEGDTSGPISVEAIKDARKRKANLRANGTLGTDGGPSWPRPEAEPLADKLQPLFAAANRDLPDIAIDAELILAAAKAICTGKRGLVVQFHFARNADGTIDHRRAVRLSTLADNGAEALVMPYRM